MAYAFCIRKIVDCREYFLFHPDNHDPFAAAHALIHFEYHHAEDEQYDCSHKEVDQDDRPRERQPTPGKSQRHDDQWKDELSDDRDEQEVTDRLVIKDIRTEQDVDDDEDHRYIDDASLKGVQVYPWYVGSEF